MRFHWFFRIAANYSKGGNVDSEHILHQLHSTGVNGPIIKLEMRNGQLSVSHDPDNHGPETNLASIPVGPLLGQWLECEEIIQLRDNGYLKETVRDQAGQVVLSVLRTSIDVWSGGFTRPKWGIYRGRESGYHTEDSVDFAQFTIQKLKELPSPSKGSLVGAGLSPKTQQNFRESRQARERYEQSLPGPRHPRE
jgi:hypothetical protein